MLSSLKGKAWVTGEKLGLEKAPYHMKEIFFEGPKRTPQNKFNSAEQWKALYENHHNIGNIFQVWK